jgi:hypothetical protein
VEVHLTFQDIERVDVLAMDVRSDTSVVGAAVDLEDEQLGSFELLARPRLYDNRMNSSLQSGGP